MPTLASRRRFLTMTAGAAALLTACGSEKPGTVASDGSVTVRHAFGETRIPAPPTRVVSAGLTDADDLLALGVVPVAVTDWFGAEPFGVWPWARQQLGDAQPVVLSLADGVQIEQIAGLTPDLIVATDAGLDQETYNQLSAIAPTIAQSGSQAFFEPWRDRAGAIGQAVFRHDDMSNLIAGVDAAFDAVKDSHPQFSGKKALLLGGALVRDGVPVSRPAWRSEFLTRMGLTVVETDASILRDRIADVLGEADVLIWTTESDQEQAALLADPAIAALPARRHVFTGKELAGAIAYASTLSYPVLADRLPPMLAAALG
ncbi:ABC transporter substrate-binding protein [Mycolicibacterium vaccae]|uniref:Periplasmic binding protein n=1 Tax=Mycolicibacterium vaccae ATCC 25954 TaxID=1194972 RepID=K0UEC1_MYCVA|nr:ABC transporter substrate-binding protein [Mycolicibacterium vaccae]ANI37578.1 iron ABC transporter substrate-binding protein [Mycolicibacterium vaccae 95051]EJZ05612.1 periplasmic binding protein [Mycolicibacterium vaccae ATCC 25954]MCV7059618.1 ABC transporter substrate-binding protein [Mycolicibacterium vaccae]